jgi:hypothetical protein
MTTGQYHEEITGGTLPTLSQLQALRDEFKGFAVIEHTSFDAVIVNILKASILAFEEYTNHSFYEKRIKIFVKTVDGLLVFPILPVKDIVCSVDYERNGKSSISLKSTDALEIEYTAGFSFESIVNDISKANIKLGILEYAKLLFESEDTKLDKVQHEQALMSVLESRVKNLYLDAYSTVFI